MEWEEPSIAMNKHGRKLMDLGKVVVSRYCSLQSQLGLAFIDEALLGIDIVLPFLIAQVVPSGGQFKFQALSKRT